MPEKPESSQPRNTELHWGIVYLREDLQDLKHDIRSLHERMDSMVQQLRGEIGENSQLLRDEINENTRQLRGEMVSEFRVVHARIDALSKRQDAHFRWLMTTLIALSGVLVAVMRA